MGLAEFLLGKENPISQFVADNRNAVHGAFAGFGQGRNFSDGLGNAALGANRGAQADEAAMAQKAAEAERARQINQTAAFLRSKGAEDLAAAVEGGMTSGADAFNAWYQQANAQPDLTANQNDYQFYANQEMQAGRAPMSFAEWVGGDANGGGTEYGLTPIWGQMPDGTFGYGVQGKDGSFQQVDTGNLTPLDPRTLAGERAFGTELGGAQGAAVAGAPGDITTAQTALDLVNQIKGHPELDWATGPAAAVGMNNPVLAPGRFAFQNLVDQAKSGAFLTAIQEMRGMGALSNAEGQTATQAITRMDTALSKDDFLAALSDYERIVTNALQRAQGRLGTGPNVGAMPSAGQVLTYNPATGRLE